ncbi:MAG: glycosyltransferase family 4 protein, partial [Polyangiales bacterium]
MVNARGKPTLRFVNQHSWPDVAATAQQLADLAEHLAREGFDVDVLTSRPKPADGKVAAPSREVRRGVSIHRVTTARLGRAPQRSDLGRIAEYATFYAQLIGAPARAKTRDAVVFLTMPPLISSVGAGAKRLRGKRYALWSVDLHPDAEFESGMVRRRSALGRLMRRTTEAGCRNADLEIDLGAYMKRRIVAHGVSSERMATIPLWSHRDDVEPLAREDNPLRRALGHGNELVVMRSGNAGLVHDFQAILEAMRRLRHDDGCLFVGDGRQRPKIEAFAREHALTRVAYHDYFSREQLRHSLTLADAHFVSPRAPFVGIAVPAKLYGAMAAGRPVI